MNVSGAVLVLVATLIALFVMTLLYGRWSITLARGLSINAICAACFAGPFVRSGVDRAAVAFLFVFGISSLFTVIRWCGQQRTVDFGPSASEG